jgi:hypothetical protein
MKENLLDKKITSNSLIEEMQKRLYWYERGLKNLRPGQGFCSALIDFITKEKYPELWKYKPWYVVSTGDNFVNFLRLFGPFWFRKWAYRKRVHIFNNIIEDLKIKIDAEISRQKEIKDRLDDLLETNKRIAAKQKELNKLKNLT